MLSVLLAGPARAQEAPVPQQAADSEPGFMTGYRFHLAAARLLIDDELFSWDADFGGDVDLWTFRQGRINFLANYKAVLGDELRAFDVNQGVYTLDFRGMARVRVAEVGAVFHHVSRHLSDRPRLFPIDWNMAGVEASVRPVFGRLHVQGGVRAFVTLKRSFVDYLGELGAHVRLTYPAEQRVAFIAAGSMIVLPVDGEVFDRGAQSGGRAEAGVRIVGGAGALELFGAVERRVDAYPLVPESRTWGMLGFRLVSR